MTLLNKSFLLPLFCMLTLAGFSQETLVDLTGNGRLGAWEEAERRYVNNARALGDTLDLPFFDDFSEPFSRLNHPHDLYPSLDRWFGKTVYVNNHMAINPISQGVATFDGLDENGLSYGFGFSTPTLADSLTSKPINLFGATDSVHLSFYYQAQGLGNAPETLDLLTLEFKDTSDTWNRVWEAEGYILEDYDFNRVMLPIVEDEYLFNGFQFRFLNYASRAGNVDHWHIDYIELDEARPASDTILRDVAFLGHSAFVNDSNEIQAVTNSLILEYQSMPWDHFNISPGLYMDSVIFFLARNNSDTALASDYNFNVFNSDGEEKFARTVSTADFDPFVVCGNQVNTCNLNPNGNFEFDTQGFEYPTDVDLSDDSAYFVVQNVFGIQDDYTENDTAVFIQHFYNYYAYDDGTAELAYGLGNLENPGYVAIKFDVKEQDDLQAIQLYLNPVEQDITDEPVKLMVWAGANEPGEVRYESAEFINLSYSGGVNYFYNYVLDNPLDVPAGIIWIGWRQEAATGVKFSVGFDVRTDNSQNTFYNLGATWNQSSIPGAVMIRPVFGDPFDWVSGVDETSTSRVVVYPNPTTGTLHLQESFSGEFRHTKIAIYDLTGRHVFSQNGYNASLELGHLVAGTYILDLKTENGNNYSQRVVLQP